MRGANAGRALEVAVERDGGFRRGERVLVACSGGPDSVGLAAVVSAVAPALELRITLGHVNHSLRPSAWQDEAVVLRVAAALGRRAIVAGLPPGPSDEASLRDARYATLARMAREAGASVIATGHTAEDQTETVLLALFRGTGPQGLAGIAPRRQLVEGIDLVRPMLRVGHSAPAAYCHDNALPYAFDPTNASAEYRRNAVRAALNALRPAFPGLDEAVSRTAELIGGEAAGTPRAALRRRVREVLRENASLRDVDFEHIEAAVRALEADGKGRFFMNAEVELQIDKGEIMVRRRG